MARRLRGIAPDGTKYVVHFDRDWREWQVKAYRKNKAGVWKFAEGPTYYAYDREDAEQAFWHLVGHAPAGTHVNPPKSLAPIDKTIIDYGMAVVDGQGTIHWLGGGVTHCGKRGIRTAYRIAAEQCMKHAAKIHDYKAVERIAHAMHASGL
jgi:hypothetical protein